MAKVKVEAAETVPQAEQSKYPKEELLVNAEALFGVKREVLLAAIIGDQRTEFAVDEVKGLIKSFLERKVG